MGEIIVTQNGNEMIINIPKGNIFVDDGNTINLDEPVIIKSIDLN